MVWEVENGHESSKECETSTCQGWRLLWKKCLHKAGEGTILTGIVYAEEGLPRSGTQRWEFPERNWKTVQGRRPVLAYPGEKTGQIN